MKALILGLASCFAFSAALHVSMPDNKVAIPTDGVAVVEFNASFNKQNRVDWIEKLSDCKTERVDIALTPNMQSKYKIVVVPTVVVFNNGKEVKRFQANIMMQLDADKRDVQEAVDSVIMSDF
tara:strand:+ start:246 stop:614 length:369 start_codon:yes stop_codon:yes gene_type:complete